MVFPFSLSGFIIFPKAQSRMRSVEDVCAKIEEMVSKAKGKTTTRQSRNSCSSFVLPDWNMLFSSPSIMPNF